MNRLVAFAVGSAVVVATAVTAPAAHADAAPTLGAVYVAGDGPGDLVRVTGTGFAASTAFDVAIVGATSTAALTTATSDSAGIVLLPTDARIPLATAPGTYRLTVTAAGAAAVTSPSFLVRPPQTTFQASMQAGAPPSLSGYAGTISLDGLANTPDVVRTVTIDGTAVDTLWYSDTRSFGRADIAYAVPTDLAVGNHRVVFTQTGPTPYTAAGTVAVRAPEINVSGGRSSAGSIGVAVWNSGYDDVVDLTIVGAAGDSHTQEIDGDANGVGLVFDLPHVSPGVATITSVSRHNGATASATFTIDPTLVTSPGGLAPNSRVVTPAGDIEVVMQRDGNLVLYDYGNARWSSRTGGHPGAKLVVQPDGNAVVRGTDGRALWNSGTSGIGTGARFGLDADGNVVVLASTGRTTWSTFTYGGQFPERVRTNQYLFKGQSLYANLTHGRGSGFLYATMQSDGNFVVAEYGRPALWSTRTQGHPNAYLLMQNDGTLVVRAPNGPVLWSNGARSLNAYLVAQSDGNVVEYAPNGKALWSTRTVIR